MTNNINEHISGQFNTELESIRNKVLTMGGLVVTQLRSALDALSRFDDDLAHLVIEQDQNVNSAEINIDEECSRIIAKRQPTASDLRLLLSISKINSELERIGDSATKIANVALSSKNRGKQKNLLVSLDNMGQQAIAMLDDTLTAFARMDAKDALDIHKRDAKLDLEYEGVLRQLMTYMMEDPRSIPNVLDVIWSIRAIERVGDRCKNICEFIIYYVKGKDVRHLPYAEMDI